MNKCFLYLCFLLCTVLNSKSQISNLTPFQIPNLKLWLRSDSLVMHNQDSVYQWNDVSGNLNNATQANKLFQPNYTGNVFKLNNKPIIKFDGFNDFMNFQSLNIRTVFILVKHESPSTSYNTLLGNSNSYRWHGGVNQSLFNNYVETSNIINGQGYINGVNIIPINMEKPSEYSIIELFTTNPHPAERITGDNPSDNGFSFWKGDFAEIIIYDRILSNIERTQIENYLFTKYAPPIILPNDLTLNNSFCNVIISPLGYYANYLWSTGVTTRTISVNTSGKYWVNATNIFGKVSSDTILVSFPNYQLPLKNIICKNDSLLWNTNMPKSDYTFQWQDNSVDSLFNIKQAGNYYVKISDAFGCSVTSNTITITEDNFATTASLGPDVALCAGNELALVSGLQAGLSYTWSTNEFMPAITVTNTAEYSVIITNTNSCVAKDTINVTITGQVPSPNFSTNNGCVKQLVYFTNASVAPAGNTITQYSWDFGDASSATNTSTLSNPSHTYTNTGTYTVSLTVSTDVGCAKTITKTLTVAATPTVNFTNGIACQNDATGFTGAITSSPLTTTLSTWHFGDPASGTANTATTINPQHVFSNQGNYTVSLKASNNMGCSDSATKTIAVRAQVKADFTYSPACANVPMLFQDNSITPPPSNVHTRTWKFGNSSNSFIGLTSTQTFTNSGVYTASLTVTGLNGCVSSIQKLITVQLKPVADFTVPSLCAKDTVSIINNSLVGSGIFSAFNWKLNNVPFSSANSPTLSVPNSNTYSLSLMVVNSALCKDSVTKTLTVLPLPNVDFITSPASFLFLDSTVSFIPSISNGLLYNWLIAGNTFTEVSPSYTFNGIGSYTASLFLTDVNGCSNTKIKTVRVFDHYLDLAIKDIITSIDNQNYLTIRAQLLNLGTVPIANFELSNNTPNVTNNKETWSGQLNPGNQLLYEFVSKNKLQANSDNEVICIAIESINFTTDNNTVNNQLCVALSNKTNQVLEPYPNPSFKEDVIISIILNKSQAIAAEVTNSFGQTVISEINYDGVEGLNFIKIPSSSLSRGTYFIKITINENVVMKKLMKN